MVFSLAVTGLFWRVLYQPDGPINRVLGALGLGGLERQWLADPDTALYAVLVAAVWRQVGYVMVLYLAGLKGMRPGAGRGGRGRRRQRLAAVLARHDAAAAQASTRSSSR